MRDFSASVPDMQASRMRLRFLLTFGACLVVGNLLLALPWTKRGFSDPWIALNASVTAMATRGLGFEASSSGSSLRCGPGALTVKEGCDGVLPMLILASAILAFPAPLSRRLAGVILGTLFIFTLNIVRLVNLLLVAAYDPGHLELFHVYIWQVLMGVLTFGAFLLWGTLLSSRR